MAITTLAPKYFSKGNCFLIPLRENEKPIFLHLSGKKFKLYAHENKKETNYSIGIDFSDEDVEWIQEKETKIQNLAMENLPDLKKNRFKNIF